ncbi:hypothetical protein SDC9_198097 [bioreactor metagenome]|uniref:Uncharacterized protein n=1 Tax=bioreactor metagenome TaxID=1076179 RepID=A0A645IH80_9ZZZZ
MNGFATHQFNAGSITIITGVENNDFITGMNQGLNGNKNGNRGSGGNGDFSQRINHQLIAL